MAAAAIDLTPSPSKGRHAFECAAQHSGGGSQYRDHAHLRTAPPLDGAPTASLLARSKRLRRSTMSSSPRFLPSLKNLLLRRLRQKDRLASIRRFGSTIAKANSKSAQVTKKKFAHFPDNQ